MHIALLFTKTKIQNFSLGGQFSIDIFLYLLVSSADIFCKQFGTRSGPTSCRACSGSKLFDTLMVFLKESFERLILKTISRRQKKHKKFPRGQRVKGGHCPQKIRTVISLDGPKDEQKKNDEK